MVADEPDRVNGLAGTPGRDEDPTPGQILAEMSEGRVGGESYDAAWAERAKQTMW